MFTRLGQLPYPKKIKAVKVLQLYCFKIHINIFLSSTLRSWEWSLSSGFAIEILYDLSAPMHAVCLTYHLLVHFITRIISDKTSE